MPVAAGGEERDLVERFKQNFNGKHAVSED